MNRGAPCVFDRVLVVYTNSCMMTSSSSSSSSVSLENFKVFHSIDRELYSILVIKLWRDPIECMQIMALWLWLERMSFSNVVKKILSLPCILINDIADEAVICLSCINNDQFTSENSDIPLIQSVMEKEISLKYFHDNRLGAIQGLARIVNEVCIRALYDIMHQAIERNANQSLIDCQKIPQPFQLSSNSNQLFDPNNDHMVVLKNQLEKGVPPENRTLFVTFSKGYPVKEWEVTEFFTRSYGDCIESLHMQEVESCEQSLFARIVFRSGNFIQVILNGMDKAKFSINGKHVWARKFVPKRP